MKTETLNRGSLHGMRRGDATLEGMAVWRKLGSAKSVRERTREQQAWDSAILAAAEYVRRRMNYDETLTLAMHGLLTPIEENEGANSGRCGSGRLKP